MARIRKAQILGVGLVTPALTGIPHAAVASTANIYNPNKIENVGVASPAAAMGLLQQGVFALTPAEKLKIGGDRIRLSQNENGYIAQPHKIPRHARPNARPRHAARHQKGIHTYNYGCPSPFPPITAVIVCHY